MARPTEPLLVIDIGGTTVKYGVWAHQQLGQTGRFDTPQQWPDLLNELLRVQRRYPQDFAGVAISLPGSVDTVAGKISGTSAVEYLNGFPIKAALRAAMGVPVSIQNDANCAALAESWRGNARDVADALFMIIGTGVGGAMLVDHQLVTGRQHFTGEFGYMVMNERGETLSELASPVRMARRYSRQADLLTAVSAQEVYDAAAAGDAVAQQCITAMMGWLSVGAFNSYVSVNPQRLLIGGGISARPGFVAQLRAQIQQLMYQHGAPIEVDVQPCQFRNEANLIGAVRQFDLEFGDTAPLAATAEVPVSR
ncbi:ROK family protein [Levilactobacillus spicheri]|uniref:Transcriptional regulator n=2 Tax=Levilactobacillus spicheri TaxID=216463 RepID=A0ABQ0WSS7_9LACO|nr:ROK family protein [Levilactobacillus spicheri]KRL47896.1 transcriptional regulator sugar kinase [Levilactobacillus spicheri DSM 15429]GEO68073.1 transcriptional regulator [Levilactobacillus spicheri]